MPVDPNRDLALDAVAPVEKVPVYEQPLYKTIVIDPPWKYNSKKTELRSGGRGAGAEHHYPTMTNEEISDLDVGALVEPNAHLYLWVTNPVLTEQGQHLRGTMTAMDIVRAWGFQPKALLTWVKATKNGDVNRGGMGWYFRGASEHVVFAMRGKLPIPTSDRLPNVFLAPRSGHSSKPAEFFRIVEKVSPGPYLEMFARAERPGWDRWGNEVEANTVVDLSPEAIARREAAAREADPEGYALRRVFEGETDDGR